MVQPMGFTPNPAQFRVEINTRDDRGAGHAPSALPEASEKPVTTPIDLIIGPVMLRLDPATSAARIAELVLALRART